MMNWWMELAYQAYGGCEQLKVVYRILEDTTRGKGREGDPGQYLEYRERGVAQVYTTGKCCNCIKYRRKLLK